MKAEAVTGDWWVGHALLSSLYLSELMQLVLFSTTGSVWWALRWAVPTLQKLALKIASA